MLKGFNVVGSFYNKNEQTVLTESDVVFNAFQNVQGLVWNPTTTNPEQIKVTEDGIYNFAFLANTNTPAQFSYTLNGVPVNTTTQGCNRGAGQISMDSLLTLNQGDVITVRNHTSSNGSIIISKHAGGIQLSLAATLVAYKLAPIVKPEIKPVDCKVEKYFSCYYEKFRNYLLCKHWLQIVGSAAYAELESSVNQTLLLNDTYLWENNTLIHNVTHQQGKDFIVIEKSGIYNVSADIMADEASQMTLFINDVADLSTVFGRDSGAARCLLRQYLKLNKGDVLKLRNWETNAITIHCPSNAGGSYISLNRQFTAFLLTPSCEHDHNNSDEEPKPCPPMPSKPDCKDKCKNKKK